MAAIIRNPAMMQELENGNDDYGLRYGGETLPTPLSKIDPPYAYRDHSLNYRKLTNKRKKIENFDLQFDN